MLTSGDAAAGGGAAVPYEYATSHPIVRLVLDGRVVLRKDLRREALMTDAQGCKPAEVTDPRREPAVYRTLLAPAGIGPALVDSGEDWILVERVPGVALWQIGDLEVWAAVATWLPSMHGRLARAARVDGASARLLRHDRGFHRMWLDRARPRLGTARATIASAHAKALHRVMQLPQGVIHGELYPSNVMVAARGGVARVWPIDWEMAAVGPLLMDLAALTTGWELPKRRHLVDAYADAVGSHDRDDLRADVDACRLLQAVQWLGWANGWQPPAEHRQDWLGIAHDLARDVLDR